MADHPLQHFLVLQSLFRYDACAGAVKRNRLVSRSWREASTAPWMKLKKYPVLLYSVPAQDDGGDPVGNGQALVTLSEFYALYLSGDPTVVQMVRDPPQKVILHEWEGFGHNVLESSSLDKWFWTWATTSSLHKMTLVDCHFKQEITVFTEYFLRGLPNLGELTLRNCVVHQSALGQINEEHNRWMEYPGRDDWIMRRRLAYLRSWDRALRCSNFLYNQNSYQHEKLISLDITLTLALEGDCVNSLKPPLKLWGPLLAMLPCLRRLRIGGYEETDAPPPQLKYFDDYEDWQVMKFESFEDFGNSYICDPINTEKLMSRRPWVARYVHDSSPISLPCHRGYFWELFWEQEIGQVEKTLCVLDILDLSRKAQEYGVLSACESMDQVRMKYNGQAEVFVFRGMRKLAFDLGIDVTFAEKDILTLRRWFNYSVLESLQLYRAPFGEDLSSFTNLGVAVNELKLWGNVSPDLEFLFTCYKHSFRKLIWITSCFEKEFCGKRLHHLLKTGRKAYPLIRQDLVEKTDWQKLGNWQVAFPKLYHLELDWGPLSLKSWEKLGKAMPNLTFLKGIVADDKQLALIVTLWPGLKHLKFAHGSRVTSAGLLKYLPKLKLEVFKWSHCHCTQEHFQAHLNIQQLRQVEMELKKLLPQTEMKLPWKSTDLHDAVGNDNTGCMLAEWENALLTGNSTKFFELYENKKSMK